MVEVEFEWKIEDGDSLPLDEYELNAMFEHTRQQITRQVEESLAEVHCPEHDQPPRVKIIGRYSHESQQLDIQYHIDTCCKLLLLESVQALNR